MADYEMIRLKKMQENMRRMEELGIQTLAYEATCMKEQNSQKKSKTKSKNVVATDNEYNPCEEGEHNESNEENDDEGVPRRARLGSRSKKVMARGGKLIHSSEKPHRFTSSMSSLVRTREEGEEDESNDDDGVPTSIRLDSRSKKVMAGGGKFINGSEKSQHCTSSMASLVKTRCQTREMQKKHMKNNDQQEISSLHISEQEKASPSPRPITHEQDKGVKRSTSKKNVQSKTLISPGSLGAYVRMKKNPRVQAQIYDGPPNKPIQVKNHFPRVQTKESSEKQQLIYRGGQLFDDDSRFGFGLMQESEAYESFSDHVSDAEKDAESKEIENGVLEIENEFLPRQEQQDVQPEPQKAKRTRGPSLCKDVHDLTINSRLPIVLNGLGQPIGPDKETLDKFSRFLGSLARNSSLAPLNELDWRKVRNKDKIWDYVKKKFIIADEGKKYVLQSVGALWRAHKTRVKGKYYTNPKNTVAEEKPPIPESQLNDLLNYWDLEEVKKTSEKKRESSKNQKNRHTMGPVSFARKRHELEKSEGKPPSLALMYMETRKRTSGRKYKTSEVDIDQLGKKNHELLGRCSKRVKAPSKSSKIIPDEFLQPYKDEIVKDTVAGVLKMFERHLPSDVLGRIASSFENQFGVREFATTLNNGQSSLRINDQVDEYGGDEDGDSEANNDDDDIDENED